MVDIAHHRDHSITPESQRQRQKNSEVPLDSHGYALQPVRNERLPDSVTCGAPWEVSARLADRENAPRVWVEKCVALGRLDGDS